MKGKIQNKEYNEFDVDKPRVVIHIGNRLDKVSNQIYYYLLDIAKKQLHLEKYNHNIDNKNLVVSRIFKTSINDINEFFNIKSTSRTKKYLDELDKTGCKVDIFKKNYKGNPVKKEIHFNLLSQMIITDDNEVEMVFPSFVEKELENPQFFTKFDIRMISNFKSKFSLILYENSKSYIVDKNPNCQIPHMELVTFKKLMGVEDKYSNYKDLRKKVIDVAVNEINDTTDIDISYEVIKKGRKVDKLVFKSFKKKSIIEEQPTSINIVNDTEFIVFKTEYIPSLQEGTILSDNQDGNYSYNHSTKELMAIVGKRSFPTPKEEEKEIYIDLFTHKEKSKWFNLKDFKHLVKNYKQDFKRDIQEDERDFDKDTLELKEV